MFKLLIIFVILKKISVESCSTSAPPARPRPPAMPEYIPSVLCAYKIFKEYKQQENFISELPDSKRIGELSLVGSHQSISYSFVNYNDNRRKQEINIMNQLISGVRLLDITLYVDSDILMVSTGDSLTDNTFGDVLNDGNTFLSYNQGEILIIKLSSYKSGNTNTDMCDLINQYRDNNIGGSRLAINWNLNDTLEAHRGTILLASEEKLFKNCTFSLKACLKSNNIDNIKINTNNVDTYIDREWSEYLMMVNTSFIDDYPCNVYDLSIKNNYFPVKNLSKYGGYHFGIENDRECVNPINFKLSKYYPKSNLKELNIVIMDYVTSEVINRVNQDNFID